MTPPPKILAHVPFADEAGAHLVTSVKADGTIMVRDSNSGEMRQIRLAVEMVGTKLTVVAVGDP